MRAAKATRRATVGTKEAAALLGCSEERVRRMIRSGELRAEKVRGRFGMEYQIDKARLSNGAAKKPAGISVYLSSFSNAILNILSSR